MLIPKKIGKYKMNIKIGKQIKKNQLLNDIITIYIFLNINWWIKYNYLIKTYLRSWRVKAELFQKNHMSTFSFANLLKL